MDPCDKVLLQMPEADKDTRRELCTSKRTDRSCCARIILGSCVLLCVLACTSLNVYTQSTVKGLEEKLNTMQDEVSHIADQCRSQILAMEYAANEEKEFQDESAEINRRSERSENDIKTPPYIHLFGESMVTVLDVHYFGWAKEGLNPGLHGFELIRDGKSYYKIKIKHHGVYLIYTQVAVHGRHNLNEPHVCAHETVRHNKKDGSKVLLSSLVTQYQLGVPYQGNAHNQWLRALDTKVHMGVFMLNADDELSVQIPERCRSMEYSMTPEQSYFGVVQISQSRKTKKPKPPKAIAITRKPRKPTPTGKP